MGLFSCRSRKCSSAFLALCLLTLALFTARGHSQSTCINQSPRDLTLNRPANDGPPVMGLDYNYQSTTPLVVPVNDTTVQYQGHTLHICDRHYHVPVENLQGCKDEKVGTPKDPPPVGQWIEFHSVYALVVDSAPGCAEGPDRDLACCRTPPFVVRASSAKVTERQTSDLPFTQPNGRLFAEWVGSNTSPDKPPSDCKPLPAQWSFAFGCEFTVRQDQLEHGMHPHGAREVQPPPRGSPDLTVLGNPLPPETACRNVRTDPIANNNFALACQAACKAPLNRFSGHWTNVPATGPPQYALCNCCPLPRP
jgi:hypothetical protein